MALRFQQIKHEKTVLTRSAKVTIRYCRILGIRFLMDGYEAARTLLAEGRLMVVPAAPALATIKDDERYHEALKDSDFAIPDSSFMVLLIRLFRGVELKVLSGLKLLDLFLSEEELKQFTGCLFLVDPNEEEKELNHRYLLSRGVAIDSSDHYVAPMYDKNDVHDSNLLAIIESKKPKYILINLGGGVQEKLGVYLKRRLDYRPGILCTGAAIAFLTGKQARISPLVDNLQLGWLVRCVVDPRRFVPRYIRGFSLISIIFNDKQ